MISLRLAGVLSRPCVDAVPSLAPRHISRLPLRFCKAGTAIKSSSHLTKTVHTAKWSSSWPMKMRPMSETMRDGVDCTSRVMAERMVTCIGGGGGDVGGASCESVSSKLVVEFRDGVSLLAWCSLYHSLRLSRRNDRSNGGGFSVSEWSNDSVLIDALESSISVSVPCRSSPSVSRRAFLDGSLTS